MKTKSSSVVFACLLTLPAGSLAVDIRLAAELMHFDYEETDISGNTLNRETGFIPGITVAAAQPYRQVDNTFEFSLYGGEVDYDGQTQSGQPHQTTTEQRIYQLLYRLGWSPQNTDASIYGKAYWQQWDRDIQPNNGVQGLFERYQWWTLEAGADIPLVQKDRHRLLLELGLLTTFNGTILVDLGNLGFGEPVLDLGNGIGFAGELNYRYNRSKHSSLQFGLQFRAWEFGRSNSKTVSNGSNTITITEPDSVTRQTILSASYIRHF